MSATNPYGIKGIIPYDSDMFFGRQKEMRRIIDMLAGATPQCVSIVGERLIGKSSLAARVFHHLKSTDNILPVFLDCAELSEEHKTKDHFFQLLNQRFLDTLEQKKEKLELLSKEKKNQFNSLASFSEFLEKSGEKALTTVVFLDEFEYLPAKKFADDTFFSNLRSLTNKKANRLAIVTISQDSLKKLAHSSIKTSGFWNIFFTEIIGLLDRDSIYRLREYGFKTSGIALKNEEIEKIHYYAGDFPFLNQLVCRFIWDAKIAEEALDWDNMEVEIFPYYEGLWEDRDIEEQKLLKNLERSDPHRIILKKIKERGLVIKKDSSYLPFAGFFRELVERDFRIGKHMHLPAAAEGVKEVPYGVADYEKIRKKNYYYVDKTSYLEKIENAGTGEYLFLIRPRRFGKTLFLSMMSTYYDINKGDGFDFFFKGTDIFKNPSLERNSYLILKFDFSQVSCLSGQLEDSFLGYILEVAELFISRYEHLLEVDKDEKMKELKQKKSPSDILRNLTNLCRMSNQKIFVIIDEYDNFSNIILSDSGEDAYRKLTHGEGFFKDFFRILKGGTSDADAPVDRLFITGVSPITLDDVTSSLNISRNISIIPAFHQMLGFSEYDVKEMIEYYRGIDRIKHSTPYLMKIMKAWYNNYVFSTDPGSMENNMYNPDMVLYFLNEYFNRYGKIPGDLIDRNVRTDYGKLRHLVIIDQREVKRTNRNFSRLKQVVEDGKIEAKLAAGFPLAQMHSTENFISLLFYLGLLTIGGEKQGKTVFEIPNQTIKTLYYDYIIQFSNEVGLTAVDIGTLVDLLQGMAFHGKWRAFFKYISGKLNESTSLRDYLRGEKVIQGFLLAWLGISSYFIVDSEKELNKGYADIVLEPCAALYPDIGYSYIVEIKYAKKNEIGTKDKTDIKGSSKLKELREKARRQLFKYSDDQKFKKKTAKTSLIKILLIFSNNELIHMEEIK